MGSTGSTEEKRKEKKSLCFSAIITGALSGGSPELLEAPKLRHCLENLLSLCKSVATGWCI